MKTFEVPLGRVHGATGEASDWLFLLMCGIGVDAGIIYSLDNRLRTYLGEGAYWLGSLDQLHRKFEPFSVHLDDRTYEATSVLVSKSRCYGGGLVITPNADLLASEFEIAIFHGRSPLRYVAYLAQLATGRLDRFSDVTFARSKRVEFFPIDTVPVYLEVDGELAGRIPAIVDIAPKTLKLLLPRDFSTV
jgi:diacylglycerol kinase (ATP)